MVKVYQETLLGESVHPPFGWKLGIEHIRFQSGVEAWQVMRGRMFPNVTALDASPQCGCQVA